MRQFAILVIVCSVVAISKAAMTEEQANALKKIVMDCAEKEKATQADLEEFMAHKPATSPTAKCHRACLHENFGTMKDNKFSKDGFMAMMKMKYDGDAEKMKAAQEVATECGDVMDADRCEAGAKICHCLYKGTSSRGLN